MICIAKLRNIKDTYLSQLLQFVLCETRLPYYCVKSKFCRLLVEIYDQKMDWVRKLDVPLEILRIFKISLLYVTFHNMQIIRK